MSKPTEQALLLEVWQRLLQINTLSFRARSGLSNSVIEGSGRVAITRTGEHTITQQDAGTWQTCTTPASASNSRSVTFSNSYRWTLDLDAGRLRLEHLRQGPNQPVSLVSLIPTTADVFASVEPHHCGSDLYRATLRTSPEQLELQWEITGPEKQDQITNWYRP